MKSILFAALAATSAVAADVADPAAPVPAPQYRSAFQDLRTGVETAAGDWKQANEAVAQFPRGHVDLLKWEERQPAATSSPTDAPAPAASPAPAHRHP